MILTETYTHDWIYHFREQKKYQRINPPIAEKMIFAFSLLEKLAESGFEFVFKRGTSLILLLNNPQRFSKDIDIITSRTQEELEAILQKIVEGSHFTSLRYDKDRSFTHGIPKAHYELLYSSSLNPANEILLDVIFDNTPYPKTVFLPVKCEWLKTGEPYIHVNVPSIESILGDKLTAFAPNTIGIQYKTEKEIEIIKQLFDIDQLIDEVENLPDVASSFFKTAEQQIRYSGKQYHFDDIFDDIFETAILIARRDKNISEPQRSQFLEIAQGISRFQGYLMFGKFIIDDVIRASAKASYFSSLLKFELHTDLVLYEPSFDVNDWEIMNPEFNFLNRLKRTNREAFYYWYKNLELKMLLK